MDLKQVGSNKKINFKLAKMFIRKNNIKYYIAGGIKSIFDIKKAKQLGAEGVLVSSMIHRRKLTKNTIKKQKTSPS